MNKIVPKHSALVLGILSLATAAFYYKYAHLKAQAIPETEKYLESILHERSHEINVYLDQQESLIQKIAQDKNIVAMFTGDVHNKDTIDSVAKLYAELSTIKNLIFIKRDGEIIASIERSKDVVDKNILEAPWDTSELSESFIRSSKSLKTDISGFEFNALFKKPALFITTPIIVHNTLYGCIVFELDIEPIYLILRKYIGLKSTGEVTIGRIKDDKIMYIAPTRHSPNMLFKSLDNKNAIKDDGALQIHAMKHAISGEKGSGQAIDYRGQNVIAAWSYLPRINWGIVAKIDSDEILSVIRVWYALFLFFLFLTFAIGMLICIYMREKIIHLMHMPTVSSATFVRIILWIMVAVSIIATCISAYHLKQKQQTNNMNALEEAKEQTVHTRHILDESITKIEALVQTLANDLSAGTLSDSLVEKRMITDLSNHASLIEYTIAYAPYAYSKDTKFYAFTVGRTADDAFKKAYFGDVYDYTKPSKPGEPNSDWYVQVVKEGGMWVDPRIEPYTDLPSISYSVPFFDSTTKEIRGVVSISYDLRVIQKIIDEIKIGETGYGFVTSKNGTLIAFPIKSYVTNQETFITLAQEKANEKLMAIAERALTAKEPFYDIFFDTKTNQSYYVYVTQTTKADWSIVVIFANDEIGLSPLAMRRGYFCIILSIVLGLLSLIALACHVERVNLSVIKIFSVFVALLFFATLVALWKIIINTNSSYNTEKNGTIIVDQSRLNKFLNEVKENTQNSQSDEPQPLFMPIGLHIYSFSLPKIQQVSLYGNIWQKLDVATFKDVPKGIQFPQDISLSFKELSKSIENTTEIRVSTFDTTIFNEQNFSQFPFDAINITLHMSSQDLTRNIILVPDLASYTTINPLDKPGIDKDFVLPGFDIQKTFFSLKKFMPDNDFGLNSFKAITEHYQLIYNIVLKRKLLNSFIIYILPLIVILIALFATLCGMREVEKYDPLKSLAAYASLFFGLILLHRTIREQYGVASTLYIEYAFFYTYITLLLLVIHAIVVYGPNSNKTFDDIITPLALYLYWPIQLFLWLTTTVYLFY